MGEEDEKIEEEGGWEEGRGVWTFIIEEGYGKRTKEEGGAFTALATLCLLDLRRRWMKGGGMNGLDG